jgi:hypothetical protein
LRFVYGTLPEIVRITQGEGGQMPRKPGRITPGGHMWFEDAAAQERMPNAEDRCEDLVRQPLAHGVGVRGNARALKIDTATVSRCYEGGAE